MKLIVIFLVVLINYEAHSIDVRIDPLVLTKEGLVRGQRAEDGDYSSFLGIPYARVDPAKPFGDNLPPENHEEIFNAYDGSSKCPQTEFYMGSTRHEGSLDCLKLNVYVPSIASSSNRLPVMVWIHGGGFNFGDAGSYHARDLVRHGIILVTINYRLGAYGFMCLDVPSVPGNQGLKDQFTALQWVKENIAVFGGDPNDVTLSGQSAGGASVDFHIYSPHERLFNKAIIQSGTSQSDGIFVEGDESAAIKLASHLGFDTDDTNQALDFLGSAAPRLVTAAAFDLKLLLVPCKERSFSGIRNFIENDPYSFSAPAKLRNLPVLIGHTDKEIFNTLVALENTDEMGNYFYDTLSNIFNLEEEELNEASDTVRHFYIGDKAISKSVFLELEACVSDFFANHPTQRTITKYLQQGAAPIYQYVFSYVGRSAYKNYPGVGASHSEELQYLFSLDSEVEFSEEDQLVADRITSLWANFVKYGNPTPDKSDLVPLIWEPVSTSTRPYLEIGSNLRMDSRIYNNRMAFWDLFYITYGKHHKLIPDCE